MQKTSITFMSPHLGLRGTEVTMFDYASFGEEFYDWDIKILYNDRDSRNNLSTIKKFVDRFGADKVKAISANQDDLLQINTCVEEYLEEFPSEYFYIQKKGENDGLCPKNSKCLVLCCGVVDPVKHKHGHKYAFISDWLSEVCSSHETPVVPSVVRGPVTEGDLRLSLGIPEDSVVFGRTGGMDTWNIPFTPDVIYQVLNDADKDIHFIFQNTPKLHFENPNIHYVEPTSDLFFKSRFINTCDALLHSRLEGESFGVACGEFSAANKRVITYAKSKEKNHYRILGDKGIYYSGPLALYKILKNFQKPLATEDWNCYKEFEPKPVMEQFKRIFIDG